jgi:hypothetical protein
MNVRRTAALAVTAAALTSFSLLTPAAQASGGDDGEVRKSGSCATGVWKLKAKPDDGRLEVEFEVDTNRRGQTWSVRVSDNGTRVYRGEHTTAGRSGSFSLEFKAPNRAGTDTIRATATRGSTTCSGTVSI